MKPPSVTNKVAWVKWHRTQFGSSLAQAVAAYNKAKAQAIVKKKTVVKAMPKKAPAKKKAAGKKKAQPIEHKMLDLHNPPYNNTLMMSGNPTAIGTKIGLSKKRKLARDCANFYLLDMMLHETREIAAWDPFTCKPNAWVPIKFMSDSPDELLAIEIEKAYHSNLREVSEELALYTLMACGGELRHMSSRLGAYENIVCKHKHNTAKNGSCCKWNYSAEKKDAATVELHLYMQEQLDNCKKKKCVHGLKMGFNAVKPEDGIGYAVKGYSEWESDYYAGLSGKKHKGLNCGCYCQHNHDPKKCKLGLSGCKDYSNGCCTHMHPQSEKVITRKWDPPQRIDEYLLNVGQWSNHRAAGWGVWYTLAKRNKAQYMYDCAKSFNKPGIWGDSFGGKKWGFASKLVADYFAGVITPHSFVDRVWTLQHNGGPLFNKYYEGLDKLNRVLAIQAEGNYLKLASNYASGYVATLWLRNEWRKGNRGLRFLESPKTKATAAFTSMEYEQWTIGAKALPSGMRKFFRHMKVNLEKGLKYSKQGCAACAAQTYLNVDKTGYQDYATLGRVRHPCVMKGPHFLISRPNCGYAPVYRELQPDWQAIEAAVMYIEENKTKYCAACYLYAKDQPCGAGEPFNPSCSASLKLFMFARTWTDAKDKGAKVHAHPNGHQYKLYWPEGMKPPEAKLKMSKELEAIAAESGPTHLPADAPAEFKDLHVDDYGPGTACMEHPPEETYNPHYEGGLVPLNTACVCTLPPGHQNPWHYAGHMKGAVWPKKQAKPEPEASGKVEFKSDAKQWVGMSVLEKKLAQEKMVKMQNYFAQAIKAEQLMMPKVKPITATEVAESAVSATYTGYDLITTNTDPPKPVTKQDLIDAAKKLEGVKPVSFTDLYPQKLSPEGQAIKNTLKELDKDILKLKNHKYGYTPEDYDKAMTELLTIKKKVQMKAFDLKVSK